MTAPTKASRKEETALIKAELAKLTARYREQGRALREMTKRAEDEERASLRAIDVAARHANENAAIKKALRPVLAYFGEQWIGDKVRKEYRELVRFAKGEGDE